VADQSFQTFGERFCHGPGRGVPLQRPPAPTRRRTAPTTTIVGYTDDFNIVVTGGKVASIHGHPAFNPDVTVNGEPPSSACTVHLRGTKGTTKATPDFSPLPPRRRIVPNRSGHLTPTGGLSPRVATDCGGEGYHLRLVDPDDRPPPPIDDRTPTPKVDQETSRRALSVDLKPP
jgi:hypothetical protein